MALLASHNSGYPNSRRSTPRMGRTGGVRPDNSPILVRSSYPGLDAVLEKMKQLVKVHKGNPAIRDKAVSITGTIPKDIRTGLPDRRNFHNIASRIYDWMKTNIQYVRDPHGIEWLQTPKKTLELGYGDCDDQSILAGALLSSIGVPTRFKVVKADPNNPMAYSHVYLEYKANGQWKPFDPTLHTKAGDELKDSQIFASRTIPLDEALDGCGCSANGLSGILSTGSWKLTGGILLAGALTFYWWRFKKWQP